MKKLLSILLCVLLVCGTFCTALAEETKIVFNYRESFLQRHGI